MHTRYDVNAGCPMEASLEVIGGKWKGVILFHLRERSPRFSELRKITPGITHRMLTLQLRELEMAGLILRTVTRARPLQVNYTLTDLGRTLEPILIALRTWGTQYLLAKQRVPCVDHLRNISNENGHSHEHAIDKERGITPLVEAEKALKLSDNNAGQMNHMTKGSLHANALS